MEVLGLGGGLRMLMIGAPDQYHHYHQVGAWKIITTPPRVLSLDPYSSERKSGSSRRIGPMRRTTAAASSSIDASSRGTEYGVNAFAHVDADMVVHQKLQAAGVDHHHKLKIGIVGFGNFGQFLAERIRKQGHTVIAYSRGDYVDVARKMHVSYFRWGGLGWIHGFSNILNPLCYDQGWIGWFNICFDILGANPRVRNCNMNSETLSVPICERRISMIVCTILGLWVQSCNLRC